MPTLPLQRCRWPGCREKQAGPRCRAHARRSSRNHYGIPRQLRGLGAGWPAIVRAVIERDGGACQLRLAGCTGVATTADHVVPRAAGGISELWNLRASCLHCNTARGARPLEVRIGG
jgi:5-methylcytosine-specific restriction endonuclease McrA